MIYVTLTLMVPVQTLKVLLVDVFIKGICAAADQTASKAGNTDLSPADWINTFKLHQTKTRTHAESCFMQPHTNTHTHTHTHTHSVLTPVQGHTCSGVFRQRQSFVSHSQICPQDRLCVSAASN